MGQYNGFMKAKKIFQTGGWRKQPDGYLLAGWLPKRGRLRNPAHINPSFINLRHRYCNPCAITVTGIKHTINNVRYPFIYLRIYTGLGSIESGRKGVASRVALFETRSINMAGLFGESVGQFLSRQVDLPLTGGCSCSETWEEEQSYRGREKRLWIRIPTGPLFRFRIQLGPRTV